MHSFPFKAASFFWIKWKNLYKIKKQNNKAKSITLFDFVNYFLRSLCLSLYTSFLFTSCYKLAITLFKNLVSIDVTYSDARCELAKFTIP